MVADLRIIHPPSASANRSEHPVVAVQNEGKRYVFNAPEGMTRSLVHRKLATGGLGELHLFVPNVCSGVRGIPGFLMTLADSGKSHVDVYGPPALAHAIATARFFAKRNGCQLNVHESHSPAEQDGVVVPLASSGPLLDRGNGLIVDALPCWDTNWPLGPQLIGPASASVASSPSTSLASNGSKKRRRCDSDSEQSPVIAPPLSNAEAEAAELASNNDVTDPPMVIPSKGLAAARASHRRAFATAETMFAGSQTQDAHTIDDPSAAPRGRNNSAAWRPDRLPQPWVAPHGKASEQGGTPATQPISLSYVVKLPDIRGKVDVARARQLGVRPGPNLGSLSMGQSVTIVRPVDWQIMDDKAKAAWHNQVTKISSVKGKKPPDHGVKVAAAIKQLRPTEEVVIESSDCVGSTTPGTLVLLTNIPSPDHLPSFLLAQNAERLQRVAQGRAANVIIHSSPLSVVRDPRYHEWVLSQSAPETRHVYTTSGVGSNQLLYPASMLPLLRLSRLDSEIFKVAPYSLQPSVELDSILPPSIKAAGRAVALDEDLSIRLQPHLGDPINKADFAAPFDFDMTATEGLDFEKKQWIMGGMFEELRGNEDPYNCKTGAPKPEGWDSKANRKLFAARKEAFAEYTTIADRLRDEVKQADQNGQGTTRDAWDGIQVTTLGTGSAKPSRYRGVAATLLKLPGRFRKRGDNKDEPFYVLLDAGEGTLGQLAQHFGSEEALQEMLRNLKIFFISHVHGDHVIGAHAVLRARAELQPAAVDPLFVITGYYPRTSLQEGNDLEDLRCAPYETGISTSSSSGQVVFLDAEHLDYKHGIQPQSTQPSSAAKDGDDTAYLDHLKGGFQTTYDRSVNAARKKVLGQAPYSTLSNGDLKRREDEVEAQARRAVPLNGLASAEGQDTFDRFSEGKLAGRRTTREAWGLLQECLGDHIDIHTVEVDHRAKFCYGIVVRCRSETPDDDFSFSYSGDTRPIFRLEEAAKGVDLYIHEATIQDDQAQMAYQKGHSTVGGAIESGRKAGAKVTLLTHFSQRYPQMARLSRGGDRRHAKDEPILAIGMDMLTLGMNDMWKMNRYLPAMETLFKADAVGEEDDEAGGMGGTD